MSLEGLVQYALFLVAFVIAVRRVTARCQACGHLSTGHGRRAAWGRGCRRGCRRCDCQAGER